MYDDQVAHRAFPEPGAASPDSAVQHGALFPIWRKMGPIRERDFGGSLFHTR